MSQTDNYFAEELEYLRDAGLFFAKQHPTLAPLLAQASRDPDVERILEGVAFLTSRLRRRLDNEGSEVLQCLAQMLFPELSTFLPSASIVEFLPQPFARGVVNIPKGTLVSSRDVEHDPCVFRTTQDVTTLPMRVSSVSLGPGSRAAQSLTIRLEFLAREGLPVAPPISFFVLGPLRLQLSLRKQLDSGLVQCTVRRPNGSTRSLPLSNIRTLGISDADALFPAESSPSRAYRLFQEYFALPQKFAFFEVSGLIPDLAEHKTLDLILELREQVSSATSISEENIRLHCSPVVNLFPNSSDPIRPTKQRTDYLVCPSGGSPSAREVYAIESVIAMPEQRAQRVLVPSVFRYKDSDLPELFYRSTQKESRFGFGSDTYLSLGTPQGSVLEGIEVVSVDTLCSNRNRAATLAVGDIRVPTRASPPGITFRNIIGVSPEAHPPVGSEFGWRVLSHMAMNTRGNVDLGFLRSILRIYNYFASVDPSARRTNELRASSVQRVHSFASTRPHRGIPLRGVTVELDLAEAGFEGDGDRHLFASLLNEHFRIHCPISSYRELLLRSPGTGATFRFPASSGTTRLEQ